MYIDNIIELSLENKLIRLKYKKKFLNLNLYKIKDMKHVVKVVARSTRDKLGKRATIKLI